jgi:hypothetical protein
MTKRPVADKLVFMIVVPKRALGTLAETVNFVPLNDTLDCPGTKVLENELKFILII